MTSLGLPGPHPRGGRSTPRRLTKSNHSWVRPRPSHIFSKIGKRRFIAMHVTTGCRVTYSKSSTRKQKQERRNEIPIQYASKTLNKSERKWSIAKRRLWPSYSVCVSFVRTLHLGNSRFVPTIWHWPTFSILKIRFPPELVGGAWPYKNSTMTLWQASTSTNCN